jgi:uncharacterized DUF497 family protein
VRFRWDPAKAESNLAKHGVSFPEASTCFLDPLHVVIRDPDHSSVFEPRMILVGRSIEGRTLVVVHVDFEGRDEIRIISARKATRGEIRGYEEIP